MFVAQSVFTKSGGCCLTCAHKLCLVVAYRIWSWSLNLYFKTMVVVTQPTSTNSGVVALSYAKKFWWLSFHLCSSKLRFVAQYVFPNSGGCHSTYIKKLIFCLLSVLKNVGVCHSICVHQNWSLLLNLCSQTLVVVAQPAFTNCGVIFLICAPNSGGFCFINGHQNWS